MSFSEAFGLISAIEALWELTYKRVRLGIDVSGVWRFDTEEGRMLAYCSSVIMNNQRPCTLLQNFGVLCPLVLSSAPRVFFFLSFLSKKKKEKQASFAKLDIIEGAAAIVPVLCYSNLKDFPWNATRQDGGKQSGYMLTGLLRRSISYPRKKFISIVSIETKRLRLQAADNFRTSLHSLRMVQLFLRQI